MSTIDRMSKTGGWWTLLAILAAFPSLLYSGEPAETKEPPAKLMLRERTVYVPYDKLNEAFEKEGRGVFLPYAEFLKLWNAAQPKTPPKEDPKPPADAVITGGSYTGTAKETLARFEVTYKIKALGKNWSEIALPLKNVAVETVTVSDPLAVFATRGDGYALIMPRPGEYTVTLAFSARVDAKPGTRSIQFGIPPTAVSRLEITIPEKDLRIDVTPKMAATVTTPEENATKLLAFIGNSSDVSITWMPPVGKIEKGESLLVASQQIRAELGERILRLDTAISYKIERNEEDVFRVKLPQDMRLLSVKGNNIREWSTENGVLLVRLHAPAKDSFNLALRCERILEKTPDKLEVPFPAVVGALREDGFITLSNEPALRLRIDNASGLSQIDPRDLPANLRTNNLLAGFRYLAHPLALSLKIEQIQPQVQSSVTAITSLGADDDNVSGWIEYQVAKVGVFSLRLKFRNRWEVLSVGDAQTVEDYQIAADGEYKILTVNLKNKAIGTFKLPFKLNSSGSAAAGEISIEPVQVLDTQQDKGLFGISAPKAFKLTTIERNKVAPANVQMLFASGLLSQLAPELEIPLAYTYSQQPASVKLLLERRKTEIRASAFHVVTVTDTGLDIAHTLKYFIEYAGVDKLQFSVPKELESKLHVQCPNLKEKKVVAEQGGRSIVEITLQDKMLGPVTVTITHDEDLKALEREKPRDVAIPDIRAEDAKLQQSFIAVRKETALEIEPKAVNMEAIEAISLPSEMQVKNVYLSFRYFQPDRTLSLKLTRHEPVELTSTIIDLMRATFVISEEKKLSARVLMFVENRKGEQYLELELPKNASIRSLAVKGAGTSPLQRKDGGTLVKLATGGPFPVELIYTLPLPDSGKMGSLGSLDLSTFNVMAGVPVNKIEMDLYVPEEYAYMGFSGTLHRRENGDRISNTLAWIRDALRGDAMAAEVHHGDSNRFQSPPPVLGTFTTQGKLFRFQTLAPVGTIKINYWDRKLFWFIDVAAFLLAIAIGWFVTRRQKSPSEQSPLPPLSVCLGFVLVPLCIGWFLTTDAAEPFSAWLLAGLILSAWRIVLNFRNRMDVWRQSRLAMAPDPFLEDAVTESSTGTMRTEEPPPGEAPNETPGPVLVDSEGKPITPPEPEIAQAPAADEQKPQKKNKKSKEDKQ